MDLEPSPLLDQDSAARWSHREDELWPAVERMIVETKASPEATAEFNRLWEMIREEVRKAIRGNPRRTDDVDALENITYMEVLKKRRDFDPAKGTFLLWSRGIARKKSQQRSRPGKEVEGDGDADRRSEPGNQERQLPPPECFVELLNWLQEREAHHTLAFLLVQYLDWQPLEVADQLSSKTLGEIADLMLEEIKALCPKLKNLERLFARLLAASHGHGIRTLADFYGSESPAAAISHWAYGERRWLVERVIRSGAKLLRGVSSLTAGTHERLTFMWARFLRRTLATLQARANDTLLSLLAYFCSDYAGKTDLDGEMIENATVPLKNDIQPDKKDGRRELTLAQFSRGSLAEDLVIWCERVQRMLSGRIKAWNVVAYAYLCGALPGVSGPAKGGVA